MYFAGTPLNPQEIQLTVLTANLGRIACLMAVATSIACSSQTGDAKAPQAAVPAGTLRPPPADLRARSAELYKQYEAAITAPRREALAGFYHPGGATRVINGARREMTRVELDSLYRGPWNPPEAFAWDHLDYDSIGPGLVLVLGGFRWKGRGRLDTAQFLYTAILQAVDSGMTIRFEQETARPRH